MTECIFEAPIAGQLAPRLLVSVRSVSEASDAVKGGCQILDVKEPSQGSLGKADNGVIAEVLRVGLSSGTPVSAALGEVTDYSASQRSKCEDLQLPESLSRLSFVKIGLAGLRHDSGWLGRWQDTLSFLTAPLSTASETNTPRWVAVIYADWQTADAPSPSGIIDCVLSSSESIGSNIAGVLVDTWSKKSGRLLDSLPIEQLKEIASSVQQSGRFFAVAGRLTSNMLPELSSSRPDVVAVRSAACRDQERTSSVDVGAVRTLREDIDKTFSVGSSKAALPIGAVHD